MERRTKSEQVCGGQCKERQQQQPLCSYVDVCGSTMEVAAAADKTALTLVPKMSLEDKSIREREGRKGLAIKVLRMEKKETKAAKEKKRLVFATHLGQKILHCLCKIQSMSRLITWRIGILSENPSSETTFDRV